MSTLAEQIRSIPYPQEYIVVGQDERDVATWQAALDAAARFVEVSTKRLDWQETEADFWEAGPYRVFLATLNHWHWFIGEGDSCHCDSLEDGKRLCEEHFARKAAP